MTRPSVAAIVVSYNVRELLLACLATLERAWTDGEIVDIVVVDSSSHDGSADAVRSSYPNVRVFETHNAGYGAAVNVGIRETTTQYVLALNPDTRVQRGAVSTLSSYLDDHSWVGIVGPRLRYPGGREQPSRRRFPTRLTPVFESTALHRAWPSNPWARRMHMLDQPTLSPQLVDWVVGACLMIRRVAINQCGNFDEAFFLYSEEIELSWRFRRHGWRVAWLPNAEVVHYESASAGQDLAARQARFDAARIRLAAQMYGPVTSWVTVAAIRCGYVAELAIESGKWLVGHRRELRLQRMRIYRSLITSGLREDVR